MLAGFVRGSDQAAGGAGCAGVEYGGVRTDLVETTLVREYGNVSVVACASCMTRAAVSICDRQTQALRGDGNGPDMMAADVYVCSGFSASGAALRGECKL